MERIKINLATFAYGRRSVEFSIMALVAILVLLMSGYSINSALNCQKEILFYSNKIARLEKQLKKVKKFSGLGQERLKKEDVVKLKTETSFVSDLVQKDIFPWVSLLDEIERSLPKGIFLDNISATLEQNKVLLRGRAISMEKISLFLKNLENAGGLDNTVLVKFTAEPGIHGGLSPSSSDKDVILFEIECKINRGWFLSGLLWNKDKGSLSKNKVK